MKLAFDIESNGLLRDVSTVHCVVAQDVDTNKVYRFGPTQIDEALELLQSADTLIGHNIIGYDYQALREVYPSFKFKGKSIDTLILSRLLFTDILDRDFRSRPANMPAQLYGRHSLESWGHRLGVHKSEFGKSLNGDWSTYSPEMLDYCEADVVVSVALYRMFAPKLEQYAKSIETEHKVAELMTWQESEGYPFDIKAAQQLESTLRTELDSLSELMRDRFLFVDGGGMTPKRDNKTRFYHKDAPFCKLKDFNPTSRHHIAWSFQTFRDWTPTDFTATGTPRIDEETLMSMGTEESLAFGRILNLQKNLGQLSDGKNAWLKLVDKTSRIHHACMLNTNTGRQSHMKPNLAQVPSAHEYRALFTPGDGRVQVGSDASGLELRCLGHYLSAFDGGKFAKEVVEGDIHTALAEIYGTDRKSGKGVTYCLIYGGGDTKLGSTAGAGRSEATKKGKLIRKRIMDGLDGFAALSKAVKERAKTGVLKGLDGRPIRLQGKDHAALNYLLQSAGAVICKLWVIRSHELLQEAGVDYYPLAFVHDEIQLSVAPQDVERAETLLTLAMKDIEHELKFRCALDSEAQHGSSWADCH
uniref:DNA-directed DNA polymerase family A palm domain-containing protein n=1 Tax=uncultured marine virus TaxID=186617 RepID=A0A0F7LBZ0_9VIRU|nr:hypothetical protein SXGG_00025 [uncultured marine virus]